MRMSAKQHPVVISLCVGVHGKMYSFHRQYLRYPFMLVTNTHVYHFVIHQWAQVHKQSRN